MGCEADRMSVKTGRAPLDHSEPEGESIEIFARVASHPNHGADAKVPFLLYLQGGNHVPFPTHPSPFCSPCTTLQIYTSLSPFIRLRKDTPEVTPQALLLLKWRTRAGRLGLKVKEGKCHAFFILSHTPCARGLSHRAATAALLGVHWGPSIKTL